MLVCIGFHGTAQSGHIQKETENGKVSFVRFSTDTASQPMSKSMEVLRSLHQMRAVDEWKPAGTVQDEEEYTHQYYQQYYKGVRVAYGAYSVHGSGGKIETMLGSCHPVGDVNVEPALSESQALEYALNLTV
jgi:Zn-dependent metalloprotease